MDLIRQIRAILLLFIFSLSFLSSHQSGGAQEEVSPPPTESPISPNPENQTEAETNRNRFVGAPPINEVGNTQNKEATAKKTNRLKTWLGLGFNYVKYNQTRSNFDTDLNFETFKWPSSFWDLSVLVWGPLGLTLSYKNTPGSVSPTSGYTFTKTDYQWITQTIEATYFPESWKGKAFGQNYIFGLRVGGNQQSLPTIWRVKSKEFRFENTKLVMPSVGAQVTLALQKWRFELGLRYQLPQSTTTTEITSPFSFDGSIGLYRMFAKNYLTGFFWYGQWIDYKFQRREDYQNALVQGKQTLLYSNIDYRVGFIW